MRVPLLMTALLLALPRVAGAADILINNGLDCSNSGNVLDDDTHQGDVVYVRNVGCGTPNPWSPCASPGAPTQVCVAEGGEVNSLNVLDSSGVGMSGGTVSYLNADDSSNVGMSGGLVQNWLAALGSSAVTMSGGQVAMWGLEAHDSSVLTMSGGSATELWSYDSSRVTLSGGSPSWLYASGSSSVTMRSGAADYLWAYDTSSVTLSGGTLIDLNADDSSSVSMRGGALTGDLATLTTASLTWSGGSVAGELDAYGSSTITVTGSDFAVDGTPVPYGDLTPVTGTLTGTLASRDSLDNGFHQGGGSYTGTIRLAPPEYLAVPALSLSGKLLLAAALVGAAGIGRRRLR